MEFRWIIMLTLWLALVLALNAAPSCDRSFMARMGSGVLTSPNFPFNYPPSASTCNYRIYSGYSMGYQQNKKINDRNATPKSSNTTKVDGRGREIDASSKPWYLIVWETLFGSVTPDTKVAPNFLPEVVCFRFHRFQLSDDNCASTYLEFPGGIRYCRNGVRDGSSSTNGPSNVFDDQFCWEMKSWFMEIKFISSPGCTDTGFYATFNVSRGFQKSPEPKASKAPKDISMPRLSAPCERGRFTCFTDRKCVDADRVCDGVADCDDTSDEDYSHARCPGYSSYAGCDFEQQAGIESGNTVCKFRRIYNDNWSLRTEYNYPNGPRFDHTHGYVGGKGQFLVAIFSPSSQTTIVLDNVNNVPIPRRPVPRCFRFWYYISGEQAGELRVRMDTSAFQVGRNAHAWSRDGHQAYHWLQGEVEIPENIREITELSFTISGGSPSPACSMALDDISMTDGTCQSDDISATFELGSGGWYHGRSGYGSWSRHRRAPQFSLAPTTDCTGEVDGFYMFSNFSERKGTAGVHMMSRPISEDTNYPTWCLSFYYFMNGPDSAVYTIKLKHTNGSESTLYWDSMKTGKAWTRKLITIEKIYKPVQIVFEALRTSTGTSVEVGLDNIELIPMLGPVCYVKSTFPTPTPSDSTVTKPMGLPVGAIAGIVTALLLTFVISFMSLLWVRKYTANARAEANLPASRGDVMETDVNVITPVTYGEPPPLYTEMASGSEGSADDHIRAFRHPSHLPQPWEPPPAYDTAPVHQGHCVQGPPVPTYSPRQDPPPFEVLETGVGDNRGHLGSQRRDTQNKPGHQLGGNGPGLHTPINIDNTQEDHPANTEGLEATPAHSPRVSAQGLTSSDTTGSAASLAGVPATGEHLQHWSMPQSITFRVPNRHRHSFSRSFRRHPRR